MPFRILLEGLPIQNFTHPVFFLVDFIKKVLFVTGRYQGSPQDFVVTYSFLAKVKLETLILGAPKSRCL